MKKYFAAILSAALLFNLSATLSACNQVEAQEENNIENSITDFAIEAQQDMENATEITLNCVFGDMKGTYAGETKDGLPHGKGKFVSQNKDQRGWYYQGDFVEGHFEGTGKTVFQNGQVQQGSYVRDIWHPSTIQFFEFMQTLPGSNFTINQKAKEIFTSEKDYFPVESPEQLPINENITYEEICNDTEKYGNQFISLSDLSISKHTTFDITEIQNAGYNMTTPVIVTNTCACFKCAVFKKWLMVSSTRYASAPLSSIISPASTAVSTKSI